MASEQVIMPVVVCQGDNILPLHAVPPYAMPQYAVRCTRFLAQALPPWLVLALLASTATVAQSTPPSAVVTALLSL